MPRQKNLETNASTDTSDNENSVEKNPKKEKQIAERPKTDQEIIKEKLSKQPKVRIIIPRDKGESEGSYETVQINGYTLQIMKGVYVDVPQQVAEIIMESLNQTERALSEASKRVPDDERMVFDNA